MPEADEDTLKKDIILSFADYYPDILDKRTLADFATKRMAEVVYKP